MPHAELDAIARGQQADPVLRPYLASRIETQLREEVLAAEKHAAWERNHIRVYLPGISPEANKAIEDYARALARQYVARDALVKAGFKP